MEIIRIHDNDEMRQFAGVGNPLLPALEALNTVHDLIEPLLQQVNDETVTSADGAMIIAFDVLYHEYNSLMTSLVCNRDNLTTAFHLFDGDAYPVIVAILLKQLFGTKTNVLQKIMESSLLTSLLDQVSDD